MLTLVVVNKSWECDPVLNALLGEGSSPLLRQNWPALRDWPRPRRNPPKGSPAGAPDPDPKPRALFALPNTFVEVWCIADLLEHFPDESRFQSSSERKAERLPLVLQGRTPDLVIAVGTAAFPSSSENLNGAVVAGTTVFAHDGDPGNPSSGWTWTFDTFVRSTLASDAFSRMAAIGAQVLPRLVPTPHAASCQRTFLAQHDVVSLGSVNVTDYKKYGSSDAAALKAFQDAKTGLVAGSLETTHAVIRATLGDRFMFVSGIVDRIGHFDEDIGEIVYAQNFVGAHNAGIALAWMLAAI
jgi:hypothetical protein